MTRLDFIKRRLSASPPEKAEALLNALFLVATPTALRIAVDPIVQGTTFSPYYPFVLLASLFLSWQYALAVAAASALVADYLFVEPMLSLLPSAGERFGVILFMISAALVIALGNTLRRNLVELKDARSREAHLNRELQHRVKNTLAVVQGLVTQTFRDVPESKFALTKLHGRLRALADANDILRDGQWDGCSLPDLAVRALGPFNDCGAISLVGPECCLPEESCVPLVLALHELATNAVKYGALSAGIGTVEMNWRYCEPQKALILNWVERGGPVVSQPSHRGLGSKLLRPQAGLEAVTLDFESGGLCARIIVAGATLTDAQDHARISVPPTLMHSTAA